MKNNIMTRISTAQCKELKYHNSNRKERCFQPGEVAYVQTNKLAIEKTIQEGLGTKVVIDNRLMHKGNLKWYI